MKWLIAIVVIALGFYACACLHMRQMRRARIYNDRIRLSAAYRDFALSGVVTNYGDGTRIYSYTNVTTIDGSSFPCILAMDDPFCDGAGVLAITTNQVSIWLDKASGAKIIDDSYRPPLFPPGF